MSREQSKGLHYVSLLNAARSEGRWLDIPELVRKVTKHAPHRKCFILTAQAEHRVVQYLGSRPSISSTHSATGLPHLIPSLLTAIETERNDPEDVFQARVCLGWIHWVLSEPGLAISRLPKNIHETLDELDEPGKEVSEWTHVGAVKGAYIRGASQEKTSNITDAIDTFQSSLPLLTRNFDLSSSSEGRLWTESLLTRFCLISTQLTKDETDESYSNYETALIAFRAWAKFWETRRAQGLGVLKGKCVEIGVPRRHVWKAYYDTLSRILQNGLLYPPPSATTSGAPELTRVTSFGSLAHNQVRLQQRAELQQVQATYETLMLDEVKFPKADEINQEVEAWVEAVIGNWCVLCGTSWCDEDLGEGGKEAVARGVLEILYRAATKSFHSTAVLRHLFTVHSSIAEFDLALKALDTYLELVARAKDRVEKSGEPEASLDDDETILRTANDGVRMLCRFGGRPEIERARQIGVFVENWLREYKLEDRTVAKAESNGSTDEALRAKSRISSQGIATAYRAMGISQSHWARLTYEASVRTEIQTRAIKYLRKSLAAEYGDSENLESLFALGLLLAESRDIGGAIEVIKRALLPQTQAANSITLTGEDSDSGSGTMGTANYQFLAARKLVPFWHLLALLVSARQEFATAAKSCEAAFEQFMDPVNLFGRNDPNVSFPVDKWSQLNENYVSKPDRGIVDDMNSFEKEGFLQVKMTQLALIEVMEGPDVAVNSSDELLSLYHRLFGNLKISQPKALMPATSTPPPKSSSGTIRSLRGTLFKQKSVRKYPFNESNPTSTTTVASTVASRPQTMASQAPKIHVTDEDGSKKGPGHHHHPHQGTHGEKLHKRHRSLGSLRKKKSERPSTAVGVEVQSLKERRGDKESHTPGSEQLQQQSNEQHSDKLRISPSPSQVGLAFSLDIPSPAPSPTTAGRPAQQGGQPIPSAAHNLPRSKLPEPNKTPHPPKQDTRLPLTRSSSQTDPILRLDHQRRRSVRLLMKVWLLIAGLYRRAGMYEDAKEASDESFKLVQSLDLEISKDSSGSRALYDAGWEGGKTIDELWGDVYAERGFLAEAQFSRYEALGHFELALSHFPDHPLATVGLSNILLDISSHALKPPPTMPTLNPTATPIPSSTNVTTASLDPILGHFRAQQYPSPPPTMDSSMHSAAPPLGIPNGSSLQPLQQRNPNNATTAAAAGEPPQNSETDAAHRHVHHNLAAELDCLAARDRAHGLLSSLTKLGSGWDFSEAWMALARAYEAGGQIEKAKEVLWWCVELEEGRPVRGWNVVNAGGFVL